MNDQTPVNSELMPDFQTSPTSGASPAQSPYSNRAFWGAYKSLSRGLWGGIMVGSFLGACVGGLASLAVMPFLGATASAGIIAVGITGSFTIAGMLYYAEKFSIAGAAAGAVSTALEIYEERKAEDALSKGETLSHSQKQTLERKSEHSKGELKNDYTPENNPSDERFRPYYWNVGLAGAALGAAVGGLLYAFGGGMEMLTGGHGVDAAADPKGFMHSVQEAIKQLLPIEKLSMLVAAGAAAGSTFGINRYYLRQPFYLANALFEGDLKQFTKQREHERQLTRQYTKTGRIEPDLEELAPSAYLREQPATLHTPYANNSIGPSAAPGNVVKEAAWGFELQSEPGKDATVSYKASATPEGEKLFEKKFHGSWKDFQEQMKQELEASAPQSRQV